jgi:hypothetical protein
MALVSMINADRLWTRLMALAEVGATPAGGVNRQALSDGEIAAWRRAIGWAREAGLTAATDAAGNLFLTLAGRDRVAPPLLVGSHLARPFWRRCCVILLSPNSRWPWPRRPRGAGQSRPDSSRNDFEGLAQTTSPGAELPIFPGWLSMLLNRAGHLQRRF